MGSLTERRVARLGGESGPSASVHHRPAPSPDGTRVAWISDRDGRPRVWVAPLPAAGPLAVPDTPITTDADVTALAWSPDGAWLACQVAPFGGERTRVVLVDPDTGHTRPLGSEAAAVTLGAWSPSGHHLGLTIYAEGSGVGQAFLYDLRDGTSTVLATGPAAHVCAIDGDARHAVVRQGRRGTRSLELVDLRSGRRTDLVPGGGASVADARFAVTGGQLYVHTDAGGDRPALLAVTVRGTAVSAVYPIAERADDDLESVSIDPSGVRAALVWNVDGCSEIELLDMRSGLLQPVSDAPGPVVTSVAFTRDGTSLLVASEGSATTPRITRVALAGNAGHTTVVPPRPPTGRALVEPTLHTYLAEDGLRLAGWLFRPRGALGALPTLIWLHGGPEAQERPLWQPLFQALVAEGIAVFAPNVRGSGGYGRQFATADDRERRFTSITDVRATVTFLTDSGLADPRRIGVAGRSYGGYLTLEALADFPELFAVGVDVCGISDFATFFAETEPWIADAATTKYGDPEADAVLLRQLSPLHRADHIAAPLLVVHGAHDTNVPLGEAERIVEALRSHGAAPRLLLFPDEGHEVHESSNRALFVHEVVGWVAAHLRETGEQTA